MGAVERCILSLFFRGFSWQMLLFAPIFHFGIESTIGSRFCCSGRWFLDNFVEREVETEGFQMNNNVLMRVRYAK